MNQNRLFNSELIFVRKDNNALVQWRNVCIFQGIEVIRHICAVINPDAITDFTQVLKKSSQGPALSLGLKIKNENQEIVLTFPTFLYPQTLQLTRQEQSDLTQMLLDILNEAPQPA